jgi:hypothetical protein
VKVLSIDPRTSRAGNKYWIVKFEGDPLELVAYDDPNCIIGQDFTKELTTFTDKEGKKSYRIKSAQKPSGGGYKQPKDELLILQEVCLDKITSLFIPSMQVKPTTPTTATIKAIAELTTELFHLMIELRASVSVTKNG